MVLIIISLLVFFLLLTVVCLFKDIYLNNIEITCSVKGFKIKVEAKEKNTPSSND